MLETLSKKQKIIFLIILSIMIGIIICYIYSTLYSNDYYVLSDNNNLNPYELIESSNSTNDIDYNIYNNDSNTSNIVVYICGAVKENKVVTLKENSRICDAIDAAGGLTNDADLTTINLAYILEDGEKIYIPKKGETIQTESTSINSQNSSYSNYSSSSLKDNKININKATQTELETIPGIGPSTALKIINYREENGKFKKIEDIKSVSGIGDSKYEKIKNYISIK